MAPAVTLGLLAERVASVQTGVDEIKKDLKAVADQSLDRRVTQLEQTMTWLTRTVAGVVISGLAGVAFAVLSR